MSDLSPLPSDMVARSLSSREPVFLLDDALTALDIYQQHGIGAWGWEVWALYGDGRHGHYPGAVIGLSLERDAEEPWPAFVVRSIGACRRTIAASAEEWERDARNRRVTMYFCLTPAVGGA